eukprot:4302819-Amphidinium_carterae.2
MENGDSPEKLVSSVMAIPNDPEDADEIPLWVPNRQALIEDAQAEQAVESLVSVDVVKDGASWTTIEHGHKITITVAPPLPSTKLKAMAIIHGSFAPMHPGHCAMIRDSLEFLEANDVDVCFAALAVTHDRQLTKKLTYEDRPCLACEQPHPFRQMDATRC